MIFPTIEFSIFFVFVILMVMLLQNDRHRHLFLVLVSFFFYSYWKFSYILLLALPIYISHTVALKLADTKLRVVRKRIVTVGIVFNLGILFYFKYANFFLDTLYQLLGAMGWSNGEWIPVDVLLPVGISFYTFQAISYQVDVYRGVCGVERSLLKVALYISFFPQLVAGPIVRANDFLHKLNGKGCLYPENISFGASKILIGLIKKVVFADNIGRFVNFVFQEPSYYPSIVIWMAAVAFAIQIYCDFSGYTDIAIGIAKIFGIDFPDNFRWPYFSFNIIEFWRRWHISLSKWLRDYLYIPLGGNKNGFFFKYRNIVITMFLGGLWHGANWNFMLWGLWHGTILVMNHIIQSVSFFKTNRNFVSQTLQMAFTFYLVLIGWIIFRVEDLDKMKDALSSFIFIDFELNISGLGLIDKASIFSTMILMSCFVLFHSVSYRINGIDRWISQQPKMVYFLSIAAGVFILFLFWPLSSEPFIYFQF